MPELVFDTSRVGESEAFSHDFGKGRAHPEDLAFPLMYQIEGKAKESLAGDSDVANKEVFDLVSGALKLRVLNHVARKMEMFGSGTVDRDPKGEVTGISFDNNSPSNQVKVNVKIAGDKVTVNGKTEAELELNELSYVDKFTRALAEDPSRRLRDGSSLSPEEQKTIHAVEMAIAKGDLPALKQIAPSLLKGRQMRDRIFQAVNGDLVHSPIKYVQGPDGKGAIAVSDGYDSVVIGADSRTSVYKHKPNGQTYFLEFSNVGPRPESVIQNLSQQTGDHIRRLKEIYGHSGNPRVIESVSPYQLADRYIKGRQNIIGDKAR